MLNITLPPKWNNEMSKFDYRPLKPSNRMSNLVPENNRFITE
jgi:hypothetical protein